jgi:WD40 repeat protein
MKVFLRLFDMNKFFVFCFGIILCSLQSYSMDFSTAFFTGKELDASVFHSSFGTQDNKTIHFHEDVVKSLQAFRVDDFENNSSDIFRIPFDRATLKYLKKDLTSSILPYTALIASVQAKKEKQYEKQVDKKAFIQNLINCANFFALDKLVEKYSELLIKMMRKKLKKEDDPTILQSMNLPLEMFEKVWNSSKIWSPFLRSFSSYLPVITETLPLMPEGTFSHDKKLFAMKIKDGRVLEVWDSKFKGKLNTFEVIDPAQTSGYHRIKKICFSDDDDATFLFCHYENRNKDYIKIWDLNSGALLDTKSYPPGTNLDLSHDGKKYAIIDDAVIKIFDIKRKKCTHQLPLSWLHISSSYGSYENCALQFCPNGYLGIYQKNDRKLKRVVLWDIYKGKWIEILKDSPRYSNPSYTNHYTLSQDGKFFLTTTYIERFGVVLHDVKSGEKFKLLNQGDNAAFSPSGKFCVVSLEQATFLFDVQTKKIIHKLVPQKRSHWPLEFEFSPDEKVLAVKSLKKRVYLWDTQTGNCLKIFKNPGKKFHFYPGWNRTVMCDNQGKPCSSTLFSKAKIDGNGYFLLSSILRSYTMAKCPILLPYEHQKILSQELLERLKAGKIVTTTIPWQAF